MFSYKLEKPFIDYCYQLAEKAKFTGTYTKAKHISDIDRMVRGVIGEQVFQSCFPDAEKQDYDSLYDYKWKGKKIDIKTITGNVVPDGSFTINLDISYVESIKVYGYVYFYLDRNLKECILLGAIPRNEFILKSNVIKSGTFNTKGGFKYREDVYRCSVSDLTDISASIRKGIRV